MKFALILYPIRPYVDDRYYFTEERKFSIYSNSLCLRTWEEYYAKALGVESSFVRKRFTLFNALLGEYRAQDYHVAWAFYSQPHQRSTPDLSVVSDLFEILPEDIKIATGVTYEEMNHSVYPCEEKILSQFSSLDYLIVGGFHKDDCVQRFVEAAHTLGIPASYDELLTETFFFRILESFSYDLDARLIKEGFLDPVMHEDDPEIEKRLFLGERICRYL